MPFIVPATAAVVSGSYSWKLNRDQIITAALRKLSVLPSGGMASSNQISDSAVSLNAALKMLHADGMPLWAIQFASFTVASGTNSYDIGIGKTINQPQPLKLLQARRLVAGTGVSAVPMNIYDRYDFNKLPNSSSVTGEPVSIYYQPFTDYGTLKIWPYPANSTTQILIDYQRPFQDMNNSTDALDFPNYWTLAVIYMLAWILAPDFGIPPTDRGALRDEAKFFHDQALGFGTEQGSLTVQPETVYNRG